MSYANDAAHSRRCLLYPGHVSAVVASPVLFHHDLAYRRPTYAICVAGIRIRPRFLGEVVVTWCFFSCLRSLLLFHVRCMMSELWDAGPAGRLMQPEKCRGDAGIESELPAVRQ